MVTHPVQLTVFQIIDRRLNARVTLTGVLELRLRLMRQNPGAQATFARQCTFIQQLTQISLIGRRVKAAVETAGMQVRESLPGFGNHRHRMVGIATVPHDAMLQDKLVLILHHTPRYAEFLQHACLVFGNPAGMRLKDRKHLLVVGNVLTLKQAACDLINLAMRMCDLVLQQHQLSFLKQRGRLTPHDLVQRALGTPQELLAHGKILLHPGRRLSDQFRRAHPVERWSDDLVKNMLVLTPVAESAFVGHRCCRSYGTAHGVPLKIQVDRIVHISVNAERITAPAQSFAKLFSYHLVAGLIWQLIDACQQLRAQQPDVVDDGLSLVVMFHQPVAQHLTQGAVLIGQLSEPVVIAIQTLFENRQHQDAPKLHARTTGILASTGIDLSLEQCEHFGSNRWIHINMLQTAQLRRNVVARFRIVDDVTDESAAQFNLCGFDFSHGVCLKILPKWSFSGVFDVFGRILALIRKFFSPGNPPYIIVYID